MNNKLYLLDVDGTLCDRDSTTLYPQVANWLTAVQPAHIALITNQGGVGLRYWMETGGFGDPSRYPTADVVAERLAQICVQISGRVSTLRLSVYAAFAYQAKSGQWSPNPLENGDDCTHPTVRMHSKLVRGLWYTAARKPADGMIISAIPDHFGRLLTAEERWEQCVMVGDRPEDEGAADAAGVPYYSPDLFFNQYN